MNISVNKPSLKGLLKTSTLRSEALYLNRTFFVLDASCQKKNLILKKFRT